MELAVHLVERTRSRFIADRGADRFAANDILRAEVSHQPLHRSSRNIEPFPLHLPPNLADAIDREVLGKDPNDLGLEGFIALGTGRQQRGITALSDMLMIGGWGDWQDPADRLEDGSGYARPLAAPADYLSMVSN